MAGKGRDKENESRALEPLNNMVVVGLALSEGLQEFVNSRIQFKIPSDAILWVFFIIFVSTVIRFAHGAILHFDHYYIEESHHFRWKVQPLWDLVILVWDGFVFFLLAFSSGPGSDSRSSLMGNSSLCELLTWWAILDLNQ
ncbi:hypothetical protein ACFLVB_03320 [Chloroflexota bacterium]